jgi:hypothetical protein
MTDENTAHWQKGNDMKLTTIIIAAIAAHLAMYSAAAAERVSPQVCEHSEFTRPAECEAARQGGE